MVSGDPEQEPFLFTEHLVLRALTVEDARDLEDALGGTCCHCGRGCRVPLEAFQEWLAQLIEYRWRCGAGLWAVCEKRSGRVLGICGLLLLEGRGPEVEFVYRLKIPPHCKHYAEESVGACLRFGFEELEVDRIVAVVDPDEPVSARMIGALEKAGMSYAQTKRLYGQEAFLYAAERRERAER